MMGWPYTLIRVKKGLTHFICKILYMSRWGVIEPSTCQRSGYDRSALLELNSRGYEK